LEDDPEGDLEVIDLIAEDAIDSGLANLGKDGSLRATSEGMRRNPAGRSSFRKGDHVIGIMGVDGGYAGTVTSVTRDSRGGSSDLRRRRWQRAGDVRLQPVQERPGAWSPSRKNPASRDDVYVEFLRPMKDEEPFVMDGSKYEYVRARYSDGREDIGVYSYRGDITYGYEAFNRMMGIPRKASTDPRILKMLERKGRRSSVSDV